MSVNAARFRAEGNEVMQRSRRVSARIEDARFRAHFGTSANICCELWKMIGANAIDGAKPVHLLWALMLLKLYCAESVLCTLAGGVHEQTFRKWAWLFVNEISELQYRVVSCVGRRVRLLVSHFSHTWPCIS
jgi:hypothetical protein